MKRIRAKPRGRKKKRTQENTVEKARTSCLQEHNLLTIAEHHRKK
jgi:hypothetical protein